MVKLIQMEDLSKESLIKLIHVYSKNWATLDGLWFRNVEEDFGIDVAMRPDVKMWQSYAEAEAKRIKENLKITEGGFEALFKIVALTLPSVGTRFHYRIEEIRPRRVIWHTVSCFNQEIRLKQQLGEFPCKQVGITHWEAWAKVADPRIKVKSLFCPPDPHPEGTWCKWAFTLPE